jgi:hypothetical protein
MKSVAEVYIDTVRYIVQQNSPGAGLGNLWATFRELLSEPDDRFPSWVYWWDLHVSESSLFTKAHTEE